MSVQAMAWALEDAPDVPAELVSLLVGLANHADRDGRHAWPSVATLSEYTRKSDRQVQRGLRELVTRGLIREGDQRLVLHLRRDRRPTVWDLALNLKRGDTDVTPGPQTTRGDTHVTPSDEVTSTSRGDTGDAHGVTPMSPEPSTEPSTTSVGREGDSSAREDDVHPDRVHESVAPPPAGVARPIDPDRRAELDRMGVEAQAAVAAARAETNAAARAALDNCQLCDAHGLLPSRVRCLHPADAPAPGSGRAEFQAARARLAERAARRGGGDDTDRSGPASRDQLAALAIGFNEVGNNDRHERLRWCSSNVGRDIATTTELTRVEASKLLDLLRLEAEGPPPEDDVTFADPADVQAVAARIADEDASLLARLDDEPDYEPSAFGPDEPPF